jgi:hypothetical protein
MITIEEYLKFSKNMKDADSISFFKHVPKLYESAKTYFKLTIKNVLNLEIDRFPNLHIIYSDKLASTSLTLGSSKYLVYDIAFLNLTNSINEILLNGELNRKNLSGLYELTSLLMGKYSNNEQQTLFLALKAFSINLDFDDELYQKISNPILENLQDISTIEKVNLLKITKSKQFSEIQEFFILCHEMTHFFLDEGYFSKDDINFSCSNYMKKLDVEPFQLFLEWDRIINEKDDTPVSVALKKEVDNPSLKEEVFCDLIASHITIKYFEDRFLDLQTIALGIKGVSRAIRFTSILDNYCASFQGKEDSMSINILHSKLRTLTLDTMLSKVVMNTNNSNFNSILSNVDFNYDYHYALESNFRSLIYWYRNIILPKTKAFLPLELIDRFKNPDVLAKYILGFNFSNEYLNSIKFYENDYSLVYTDLITFHKNLVENFQIFTTLDLITTKDIEHHENNIKLHRFIGKGKFQ